MDDEDIVYRDNRRHGPPPEGNVPNVTSSGQPKRIPARQPPQESVKQFWDKFNTKYPGKVFTILPDNPHAHKKAAKTPKGAVQQRAAKSYEEARAQCERNVRRIVKECRRVNQKYRDPHFDIEWDLKSTRRNCLDGLARDLQGGSPKGVKRIPDIFEKPQFYINGPTAGDVRQGRDGDCYLMAALCGLGNMEGLIDKVCVARDEVVGVYGFVFHRDGEWQQCIVDDKLYLRAPDYDEGHSERAVWDDIIRSDSEEEYRKVHQTGSRALYFASCSDENETWLPLLEKAWAKAHGDYSSIDGGFTGEAIEDLTGGVTSEFYSTDILDKDAFWNDQLLKVGKEFLFGCATGFFANWLDRTGHATPRERQGISEQHAYSIMDAVEAKGHRLVKLRNPWGRKEWDGKWSDGSKEWTAEWMQLLKHQFGNDGVFWISYEDLLKKYQHFDRTRIFGPEWHITQQWTSVHVPWSADYHSTKFSLTLQKESPVVIVLSQLDETYFAGLEGSYSFELQFRVEKDGDNENDYLVRSHGNYAMNRSVSTDITLEAGTYSILMKITARPNNNNEIEEALPSYAENGREKLIQMALSYDLAHAKGIIAETDKEKEKREEREKHRKARDRERMKKEMRKQAKKDWTKRKALHRREKNWQAKKSRSDARRVAHGRPLDEEDENTDSMDAANGSEKDNGGEPLVIKSFSGEIIEMPSRKPPAIPETAAPDMEQESIAQAVSRSAAERPGASKSELDEGATNESAQDAEQDSIAAAVSRDVYPSPPPTTSASAADNIVQPLSEVIATANAEDKHQPEHPPTPIIQINGVDAVTDVKPLPNLPPLAPAEAEITPASGNTAPAMTNARFDTRPVPDQDRDRARDADVDAASDTDSFPDFDWQSDLDMASDSDSDERARRRRRRRGGPARDHRGPSPRILGDDRDHDHNADGGSYREPWNAVCVVGLRVYSLVSGTDLMLEVIRPSIDDEDDDDENDDGEEKPETVLDRDDPAKGAEVENLRSGGRVDDEDRDEDEDRIID